MNRLCVEIPALALVALLAGCTTGKPSAQIATPKSGVACPECRTVVLGPFPSSGEWRGEPPATVSKHECPGCRSVISIFTEGGKVRHECSTCKQTPYSCQVTQ